MNNYATFGQRFAAMWIDFFVFVPIMVIQGLVEGLSKRVALVLVVPMGLAYVGYTIYCHARFGQTLGKWVMGIRVVRTTGECIGWREAWLRSSIDVFFGVLGIIRSMVALNAIGDLEYYGVGWTQRVANLAAHEPSWLAWIPIATTIWVWSEVVVMLFNQRRRSLHDLLAGTLVVSDRRIGNRQMRTA